ncbi:unnamed protein product [Brachionus calyciflorus]|uniref:Kinesin-like protein n=1 Tax=Brachionus calyciflorus TaxID=104777 RepID=A0A813VGL2_9BILA|nr:unnamed protein product [Brachionus calyciflorus]
MPSENLKVAVRVRGFNDREKALNSKCVVHMDGNTTTVKNPDGNEAEKRFAFDYSYWSFDGFKVEPNGYLAPDNNSSRYCDQKRVFDDLGVGILNNAFDGYNSSIFAYGQTGSGKSYSIIGTTANKGIVPLVCEQIFQRIESAQKENKDNQFEVTFSMIEIYNEVVRDLLSSKGATDRKGLQLHEKPGRGFHILEKDLKPTQVCNYSSIEKLMEQGNKHKSIAETKMNATSSRAHTIVELVFKQTFKNLDGNVMQRVSVVDLVDLAGSERQSKTMASGDTLKEGIAINLSLTSLGNVISALASQSNGQNVRVPYRDSTLTKLLMNALGGNSKTVMVAAISPSDNNYAETISTLRYADRAKQIKTNAKVNEDPKDKLIRELQEEIARLKSSGVGLISGIPADLSKKEYERAKKEMEENIKRQLEDSEKQMERMKESYEHRLAEALAKSKELDKQSVNDKAKICPHLSNINSDPMLTGSLKHLLEYPDSKKTLVVGSTDKVDIQMHGLGVSDRHCGITFENGEFHIEPYPNSRIMKNGKQYEEKFQLNNFDRLVFGASLYFLFINPSKFDQDSEQMVINQMNTITVEKIQKEIAEESGLISDGFDHRKPDELQCINELIDLMPPVEEANQMSILMDKKMRYDLMILNPIVIGDPHSKPRPVILVRKFGTSLEWIWEAEKFIDRKAVMSDFYLDFKEDGKINNPKYISSDPFVDPSDMPVLIGVAVVEPKCILHRIPLEDTPKVFDYCKKLAGSLHVEMLACDKQGIVYENIEKAIIQNPEKDLKELYYLIRINNVKCLSTRYKKIFCQFKVFGDENYSKSQVGNDSNNPNFKFQRMVSYPDVGTNLLKYYSTYPIFIQVLGIQLSNQNDSNKMTTRQWFDKEKKDKNNSVDKLREEVNRLQLDLDRTKNKLKNVETLLDYAEKKKKKKIRTDYIRECILSNNPEIMNKLYELVNKMNDKD